MNYKKFSIYVSAFIAVYILVNFIIWKGYTEEILANPTGGGDMTRIGYIHGSKLVRDTRVDLPRKHLDLSAYRGQQIDVLTIGDSFSEGGGFGLNPYYQDYLASINNMTVLNAGPYPTDDRYMYFNPLSTLEILYNSGYLDEIRPRYVLIESVARYALARFAKPMPFDRTAPLEKVKAYYRQVHLNEESPRVMFLNKGNFNFLKNAVLYRFSDSAFTNNIHIRRLSRPFFSVENRDKLLFLDQDLQHMKEVNAHSMALLNDNFNRVAGLLKAKGIKLVFMPIVDKYDLYSDYIVNNPYPRSRFFETLRPLPRQYELIDTKQILSACLKRGEEDVYYPDDSHWNWKGAKAVFEAVRFQ